MRIGNNSSYKGNGHVLAWRSIHRVRIERCKNGIMAHQRRSRRCRCKNRRNMSNLCSRITVSGERMPCRTKGMFDISRISNKIRCDGIFFVKFPDTVTLLQSGIQRNCSYIAKWLHSFVQCWDILSGKFLRFIFLCQVLKGLFFHQKLSRKLPNCQDNVCIACQENGLYAVGCRSYTLLLDPRTLQAVKKIASRYSGCGIRSASFQGNTLTVGTGLGMLMFYDIRAGKYLESSINASRTVVLKASKGYVVCITNLLFYLRFI